MSKSLGLFRFGRHQVALHVDEEHGNGSFDSENLVMVVGLDHEIWPFCFNVLLHESLEFAMSVNDCRLVPDVGFGGGNDAFIFLMTHPKFSEVCGQVAEFLAEVAPLVGKEFDHHQKAKRRKK